MATIGGTVLTLADWAKRLDPDGSVPTIVELLSQTNDMLSDMLFKEGNLPTGERTTLRTGLPTVYWRLLNAGVPPSKSVTAQVDAQVGMLEAYSETDKDLAELNGNLASFRLSEAQPFIESMNQEMQQTMFYGNSATAQEEFTGLGPAYSSSTGVSGQNVIKAGGAGSDNSSIWLVVWGPNTVHGIFPKGSKAGLIHEDLGLVTIETTAGVGGGRMRAYRDHWQWKAGLVIKDWRYAVRIANIDISNLVANSSAADLIRLMKRAWHRLPALGMGQPVWYMNRTVAEFLDIQEGDLVNTGGGITFDNVDGRPVANFRGIPVRIVDQLLETEATVP